MADPINREEYYKESIYREIDRRFTDHHREHDLIEKQLVATKQELDRRLTEMNEFRNQISSERMNYMRKDDYELRHALLADRIEALRRWQSWILGVGAALVMAAGVLGHFIK